MSSSNYFLEAAFVDDSDFAREVYEEALYGERGKMILNIMIGVSDE